MYILGISCFYHDSAASLIKDGKIICAAQEERFSRVKNDQSFPTQSILFCLNFENISFDEIDHVVFYDKPLLKFERIMETYFSYAPQGLTSFLKAIPIWLKEKLFTKSIIKKNIKKLNRGKLQNLSFTEHHQSHAAAAYFPSPYDDAMVLCLDGVGEWNTTSLWKAKGNSLQPIWSVNFPHSLGLLYSSFTYYCGFKINNGEYKLMGLAPYGSPKYVDLIEEYLIDIKKDGSFHLNMEYFNYCQGLTMTNQMFNNLFGSPPREPESEMSQFYMDMAHSVQKVLEKVIFLIVKQVHKTHGGENLCLAGGVALNCVVNGKLQELGPYKNIWIQPAAGDAGGSLGAALACWHQMLKRPKIKHLPDGMNHSLLGPEFSPQFIKDFLIKKEIPFKEFKEEELLDKINEELINEKVLGVFSGRTEFGPRALGNRSIIADARVDKMQSILNLKIKRRESFRPFAPIVLQEEASKVFELDVPSPYMLLISQTKAKDLPSITHVDGSARIQTINKNDERRIYKILDHFHKNTGCPVLINTSFNIRGEPIVNDPEDAINCFINTEMDGLVLENFYISKEMIRDEYK